MKKCLWSIVVLFCLALCACGQNNSANKTSRQAFTALSVAGNENAAIGKVLRDFSDGIFEYMNHPDAEDENYSVLVNECPWVDECCTEKKLIFRLMEEHKSACPVAIDEKHKSDEYEIYYLDEEEAYLRVSNQLFGYMWMVMQKTENQWKISGAAYDFVGDGQYQNENLATMRKFADKFPNAFSFGKNE